MRIVLDLQACQSASHYRGIGRYALALAKAIARRRGEHEVIIALNGGLPGTVEPIRAEFDGLVAQSNIRTWLTPMPTAALDAGNLWRTRVGEHVREAFLASLAPDVLHVGSLFEGLIDDAVTSIGRDTALAGVTAATFYDLIPLQYPEQYLADDRVRAWYDDKLAQLRHARQLLAISDSSRREAIELLGVAEDTVTTISAGVDELFQPLRIHEDRASELRARYALRGRSILYAGGMDPRKNVPALIAAFSRLQAPLRKAHQLVVVGNLDEGERQLLASVAQRSGLAPDELVVTGYVPDADLVALYNLSELFVFPSLHEGLGLPALEAMACGLAVIAANRSSLPEAVGRDDALFDPTSVDAIAEKMAQALSDDGFRTSLRQHGLRQVARFTWDQCAQRAIAAMERMHQRAQPPSPALPTAKPRLAVVTPLPPERTGIADYSVALLPHLAQHYEVEVVVGPGAEPRPAALAGLPVRTSTWFAQNAARYERVLYHIGNSPFHTYMLDLLREHTGAVVLHDFFLGNLVAHLEMSGERPGLWTRALYEAHGYPALVQRRDCERRGENAARYAFPSNAVVLRNAEGILVHSHHSVELAGQWYGSTLPQPWHVVPFPRRLPVAGARASARARLGLAEDVFVVCSFGMLAPTKLNHRLLAAWKSSSLAAAADCRLVFVGENDGDEYGRQMLARIADLAPGSVTISGFAPPDVYRDYLDAADACVQLRALSRGETSAAVLDALAHGLPTIVNANGAMPELAADVAIVLPDDFTDAALTTALETLRAEPATRIELGQRARDRVASRHDPAHVAARYRDAIEQIAARGPRSALARAITRIAGAGKAAGDEDSNWPALAACIARNQRSSFPAHQLFVDISILVRQDLKTGIERVVRGVLLALLQEPVVGYRVEPVYADAQGVYRYARRFCAQLIEADVEQFQDDPLDYSEGDVYLALDLAQQNLPRDRAFFEELRDSGVRLNFVVYDLLPMRRPDFFPEWLQPVFSSWLDVVASLADGVVCISRAVADDLVAELRRLHPPRLRPLNVGAFALGSDLQNSLPTVGVDADAAAFLRRTAGRVRLLMVGTVEPRKGHGQVLDAFEVLWNRGSDACLVVVGKPGWMVDHLVERLRSHPEAGQRLFWFPSASDELLEALYRDATGLLMASEGEGFGLPLVEAARQGLPILCRDLPVFREVAGAHAFYFSADDGGALAEAIGEWLVLAAGGQVPDSSAIPSISWHDSARSLVATVLDAGWHASWMPDGRYWFPANDPRLQTGCGRLERSRYRSTGRAGDLVHGPQQRFPAGAYRLRVLGRWLQPGGSLVLEATSAHLRETLLRTTLANGTSDYGILVETDFVLPAEVPDLQLRLQVDAAARVEFGGFEVDHVAGGFELHAYHGHHEQLTAPAAASERSLAKMENIG